MLSDIPSLFMGFTLGSLLTWLWLDTRARWRRGWGLLGRPGKVGLENAERMLKAQNERMQGWQELRRAVRQFLLLVICVLALALVLGSYSAIGRILRAY